jgi:hypothetical protein
MSDLVITAKIDHDTAQSMIGQMAVHIAAVDRSMRALSDLIYQFNEGRGYEALGCTSLAAALKKYLRIEHSQAYRLLNASEVMHNITPTFPENVTERQLRELVGVNPTLQGAIWSFVEQSAGDQPITGRLVAGVVSAVSGILQTGAFTDSEGNQYDLATLTSPAIWGEVREKLLRDKQHAIDHMIAKSSNTTIYGAIQLVRLTDGQAVFNVTGDLARQMADALGAGRSIFQIKQVQEIQD